MSKDAEITRLENEIKNLETQIKELKDRMTENRLKETKRPSERKKPSEIIPDGTAVIDSDVMKMRDSKRRSSEREFRQLICLSFMYAYNSKLRLCLTRNQIRSNKKGIRSIFDLMDDNDEIINSDNLIKEGHDRMNTWYGKTYGKNNNVTTYKKNCLNAYYTEKLNISKDYIDMTNKKIGSKNVPFRMIRLCGYLKDTFNLDFFTLQKLLVEGVEKKKKSVAGYQTYVDFSKNEMELIYNQSILKRNQKETLIDLNN